MLPDRDAQRRAWVILSERRGDNAQVMSLADALGWQTECKQVRRDVNWLMPPWPDVVLTIGRRPSELASRLQRRSGGRTRLVQIGPGDTRLGLCGFDLLVSNPQSRLPSRPNVLQLELPLLYPDLPALAAAAATWRPCFEQLPRPWTAVLIGAATPPFVLNAHVVRRMLTEIERFICQDGGSLLISTSPRTPPEVAAAVQAALPKKASSYIWSPLSQSNPYPAMLALADRFVVTADSISMQTEVIRLGKPLAIYSLPRDSRTWQRRARHFFRSIRHPLRDRPRRYPGPGLGEQLLDQLTRLGLTQHRRSFTDFHRWLVRSKKAVWFGNPFLVSQAPPPDERPTVVRRISMLFSTSCSR